MPTPRELLYNGELPGSGEPAAIQGTLGRPTHGRAPDSVFEHAQRRRLAAFFVASTIMDRRLDYYSACLDFNACASDLIGSDRRVKKPQSRTQMMSARLKVVGGL